MPSHETKQSSTPVTPRFGLELTILGAVCGALLTGVLDILAVSGPGKLIGLALGAALPPVIAALSQGGRRISVLAAVLLSVAALLITYFGFTAFASTTGKPPIVPTPRQIVDTTTSIISSTKTPPPPPPQPPGRYAEGDLGMAWTPQSVQCDVEGCGEVIVTSEGAAQLRITSLEIRGEGAAYLEPTGCVGVPLNQGDVCTITLNFDYESAPSFVPAVLVIHQNFAGPATDVPIVAHGKDGTDLPCTVPDVVGAQRDDAVAMIEKAGLVVAKESESSSDEAGTVLEVDPEVGATPECGSTVTIVVSSGPEPCTVPPVVGLTESAARAEIQKADLAVGSVTEDPEAGAMNGTVVSSDPAATSEVDCGSSVDLVVTPITVG